MRPYRATLALALCGVVLAGCADREGRERFDGNYYPTKLRSEREDRRAFTTSATRVARGIEGAQKAAIHEATRYCLENFGTSAIAWAQRGEGQEGPIFARSGDRISASGRCEIWQ